jgi:hypothetical protein
METRILIAYALIALMAAALVGLFVHYQRKRAERRRIWEGRGRHTRH